MKKLLKEIQFDVNFIKSHTLQPKWYKVLKVFIILGFLAGYWCLFGLKKTVIFFAVFILLSLILHLMYRIKTNKYQRSWLDFKVVEENGKIKTSSIGVFYYLWITINTLISITISQLHF